jgi:hypothetical protein
MTIERRIIDMHVKEDGLSIGVLADVPAPPPIGVSFVLTDLYGRLRIVRIIEVICYYSQVPERKHDIIECSVIAV